MGRRRASVSDNPSKDREDSWKKIFKGLVDMIDDQQRQLESLAQERKSLEKRFKSLHDRWVFDVKLLEDHISLMTRDSRIKDMALFVEKAKANLIISMKQKEAIMNKLKFEEVDDERADLKLLFDELSRVLAEPKRVTESNGKDVAESSLKTERDFAWNQYKKTDKKLQELVKRTKLEVEGANEKLQKLLSDLEQSESLNMEKDRKISSLHDNIVVLELDSRKKSEEISRLTKELESLRGDSDRSITPVLRRCMAESSKNSRSSDMAIIEKGGRSSKRKTIETVPRLFSSKFKVPREKVVVPASKPYITFQGEGKETTVIEWHDRASDRGPDGQQLRTYQTASVIVYASYFSARNISFKNTAPAPMPGMHGWQAAAFRISGDKAYFLGCGFYGAQDTLCDDAGRHYFKECYIEGSIDFIFGNGRSMYKDCELHSIAKRFGSIAAQDRRTAEDKSGFAFVGCRVTGSGPLYVGRAMGQYSRIVYSYTYFDDVVAHGGWDDWDHTSNKSKTAYFGVYRCWGPGAAAVRGVSWARELNYDSAHKFLAKSFVNGRHWIAPGDA